jgi:hypothetical protein
MQSANELCSFSPWEVHFGAVSRHFYIYLGLGIHGGGGHPPRLLSAGAGCAPGTRGGPEFFSRSEVGPRGPAGLTPGITDARAKTGYMDDAKARTRTTTIYTETKVNIKMHRNGLLIHLPRAKTT